MANKEITDEERERLKQIKNADKATRASILIETEALLPKEAKERNLQKEKDLIELLNGDITSLYAQKLFSAILLNEAADRDITFKPPYYDRLFDMSGLKKDPQKPQWRPQIFAQHTIKYVYDRFNIKNLLDELRVRNRFITGSSMRESKHYHYLNGPNYTKLQQFISDFIVFSEGYDLKLYQFDIDYCKRFNLTTDGDLFSNP